MALNSSQLVLGQRVRVEAFTATVTQDEYDDNGDQKVKTYRNLGTQVRVKDNIDRNSHYVNLVNLEVEVPFQDGALYLSSSGAFFFYVASESGKPGTWRLRLENGSRGVSVRAFSYPARPLALATIGEPVTE